MEFFWVEFSISAAGSGVYFVTLPRASVGLDASANEGSGQTVGSWTFRDNSGPNSRGGTVLMRATDEVHFNVGPGLLQSTFPFTVASGDQLNMEFKIPIA